MPVELKVPEMGESVVEVEVGDWLKKEGDYVALDEPVVVIESDKVTLELPAPAAGKITKIGKQKGATVQVGEVVGEMEPQEAPVTAGSSSQSESKSESRTPSRDGSTESGPAGEATIMPAAQRLLDEHGLSASQVEASGPGGRLLKEDVMRHVEQGGASAKPATPVARGPVDNAQREDVVPMSRMRRRIAERLVESQQTAALLTTFNEVDMSPVMELRNEYKQAFLDKYGVKLGFMSFFVKATIDALKLIPQVNAEIRGDDIVFKNHYDIGIAVGGGRGLVVPVLRDADRMSFAQVELAIADFAKRARDNKLTMDELQGGTFTISNGGVYGSMMSTPIINPPQSGILGMHAIKERPVAVDGKVEIRPVMYIALTYDHRIIDGRESVTFLKRIKDVLEKPSRMMLEI